MFEWKESNNIDSIVNGFRTFVYTDNEEKINLRSQSSLDLDTGCNEILEFYIDCSCDIEVFFLDRIHNLEVINFFAQGKADTMLYSMFENYVDKNLSNNRVRLYSNIPTELFVEKMKALNLDNLKYRYGLDYVTEPIPNEKPLVIGIRTFFKTLFSQFH